MYHEELVPVRSYVCSVRCSFFFFFNDTATTEIYTLSLHDALPILHDAQTAAMALGRPGTPCEEMDRAARKVRSEEHTSELQSQSNLVCRLLLEKKNSHHPPSPPTIRAGPRGWRTRRLPARCLLRRP